MENRILSTSNLVNNTKITEIENEIANYKHDKYITTLEFNILAAGTFNARISQANLITKTDFGVRLSGLNRKITKNKSEHVLVNNELNQLKTFDFAISLEKVILKKMMVYKII